MSVVMDKPYFPVDTDYDFTVTVDDGRTDAALSGGTVTLEAYHHGQQVGQQVVGSEDGSVAGKYYVTLPASFNLEHNKVYSVKIVIEANGLQRTFWITRPAKREDT